MFGYDKIMSIIRELKLDPKEKVRVRVPINDDS